MAKKVRFPLIMEDGVEVRNVVELRSAFSLTRVLEYAKDGRLITWLQDRYEDDIANEIGQLDPSDSGFAKKVCKILDVQFDGDREEELRRIGERERKLGLLKEFPQYEEYKNVIDFIASL